MKFFNIDLYEYFGVKKPDGGKGTLTCYVRDNSSEINKDRRAPAMLVIPGGGYGYCSPREAEPVALRYLAYGINAFVLDYSVEPVLYPFSLAEGYMAIEYLRKNALELGIDGKKIAAVGFSAGGHLCGLLGSGFNSEKANAVFRGEYSHLPDAVILSYPVITYGEKSHNGSFNNLCGDDEELKQSLQIHKLIGKNSAPAFIWATADDGAVPVNSSLKIAAAYENAGVPFSLHIFGKGQHGLSLADETVYNTASGAYKDATASVRSWVNLSIEWLKEQGIAIEDN